MKYEMEQFLFRSISLVKWHKAGFTDLPYPIYCLYRQIAETCWKRFFVGRTHVGTFGYADHLAPTLSSLRKMICICKKYAVEFNIMFNPGKSKLCYNLLTRMY